MNNMIIKVVFKNGDFGSPIKSQQGHVLTLLSFSFFQTSLLIPRDWFTGCSCAVLVMGFGLWTAI